MKKLNITPGRAAQGALLDTSRTRTMFADDRESAIRAERRMIFVNFSDRDQGRSRVRIASFEDPEDATLYADAHNTYHATQMLPSQMAERIKALEDGLRGIANVTEAPSQTNTSHMERCDWVARRARALLSPAINEAHGHLLTNPE
jgi:hypothetical protein